LRRPAEWLQGLDRTDSPLQLQWVHASKRR
jgi:hypothetical protein